MTDSGEFQLDKIVRQDIILITVGVVVLAILMVLFYASPRVPAGVLILTMVAFTMGFVGIIILPVDLSLMTFESMDVSENPTHAIWRGTFWVSFIFAWYVLPLTRESLFSGEFTHCRRLLAGCKRILLTQLVIILLLVSLFVLFRQVHLSVAMLGNTYGLIYISLLMGYGLVSIPRSLWRRSFPGDELRRALITAVAADEALYEAVWDVQDCEKQVETLLTSVAQHEDVDDRYRSCLDEIKLSMEQLSSLSPELHDRRASNDRLSDHDGDSSISSASGKLPPLRKLAALNKHIMLVQENLMAAIQRWNLIVRRVTFLYGITNATLPTESDTSAPLLKTHGRQSIWVKYFRSPCYMFAAFVTSALSLVILWSEATLSLEQKEHKLSPIRLCLDRLIDKSALLFRIVALVPLLYMSLCTYTSLFKLISFGPNRLTGYRQGDGAALLFNAQLLVRLQFPMCYNYLLTLKYDPAETNCAFLNYMGVMNTFPIFGGFNLYAPLLIIVLCLFTIFNVYARVVSWIGIDHEDAVMIGNKDYLDGKLKEGIALIRKYNERNGSHDRTNDDVPTVSAKGRMSFV